MKINKILKITLITLVVILLSIISFVGIYVKDKGRMVNVIKDYNLGMDLEGSRRIDINVNTSKEKINYDESGKVIASTDTTTKVASSEEKAKNDESVLVKENYRKTKTIIEKRLKTMGLSAYEIRLNEENGNIVLNIPENDNTDIIVSQIASQGKFEIVDKDTNEVLMTNDDLKAVKAGYGTTSYGTTTVFVNIEFNKEGTEKFRNITNTYVETKVTDEETGKETTKNKEITLKLDGGAIITTHFDEEITNGVLQLSVGSSSSSSAEEMQESLTNANNLSALLNNGKMPIVYEIANNQYIASEVEKDNIELFVALAIIVLTIGMIYLIIKYKEKGILSSISLIGYIALLLLVLRYTNIVITIYGLIAIILSIFVTYITIVKVLENNKKMENIEGAFEKAILRTMLILVPIAVIAVVFAFNSWLLVSSFGTVIFWGMAISLLYNVIITRALLLEN